uniref:Ribonuclease P protein subunit p29 n=1 Tax=Plectus sambesii TaxID=2011161 RepID=A0A914VY95_9BILA
MPVFVLEKTIKRPTKPKKAAPNLARKSKKLSDLKDLKYSQFVALYDLWKNYFKSCYGGKDPERADDRLLKADYHGCLLLVATSVNPSQVGLRGIVVRESRNTFLIITPDDRLLTIPKKGTTFQFVLDGHLFTLFGDALGNTSAGRSQKKFKNCSTVPYLLS